METWKFQYPAFRGYANLLLLDLRDHGNSNLADGRVEYDFELISTDIYLVMERLGIKKAVFMSLSFGSVLVQAFSLRYPGIVTGAVMAGAIFKGGLPIKIFVHMARALNLVLPYRHMYSLFSYLLMPKESHQMSRRIYRIQARRISPKAYMRWVGLYREFFRLLSKFQNQIINFPVLAVMGSDDYVFLKTAEDFSKKQPNVGISVIQNAGHICNIDRAEEFNRIALSFLMMNRLLGNIPAQPMSKITPE